MLSWKEMWIGLLNFLLKKIDHLIVLACKAKMINPVFLNNALLL